MVERSASRARGGARATSNAARGRRDVLSHWLYCELKLELVAAPVPITTTTRTNERANEVVRRGMRACDASRRVSASRCAWNL